MIHVFFIYPNAEFMMLILQKQQDFNMCDFRTEIKNISRSG